MLSGERLLIVEEEFLIALDIQRVLEDAHALRAIFARNYVEVDALGDGLRDFDLAIITAPRPGTDDLAIAGKLAAAGPAIVVCSATPYDLASTALAEAEIVDKPFSDKDLLDACRRALARRTVRQ